MKSDSKKLLLDFRNVDIDRWGKNHKEFKLFGVIDTKLHPQVNAMTALSAAFMVELEKALKSLNDIQ